MKKHFSTLAVMGAYSGFVLAPHGGGIHEVMDHFYPGIMTIGTAAMQPTASAEIKRQIPAVADVPGDPSVDWRAYGEAAVRMLGPTLELDGPHAVSDADVSQAFAEFGKGVRS